MNFSKSFKKSKAFNIGALLLFSFLFSGSFSIGQSSETFENIPASTSTSANRTWIGTNGGSWNATSARTEQTITTRAICITTASGKVSSNSVAGGCGVLTFKHRVPFSETSPTLTVWVNGVQIGGSISTASTVATASLTVNVSGSVSVEIRNGGNFRISIDDLNWTSYNPTTPNIIVTPNSLTGFTYAFGSGPSANQTFTCSGTLLTANITLTAPTNYEISLSPGSGFGTSLTLTPSSGTVLATNIYVRLKSGLSVASYNSENIICSSTGATSVNVACSGNVTAPVPVLVLSSANPAIAAGNITQNTTSNVIYAFNVNCTAANSSLSTVNFTTSYSGSTVTNLRLIYSTDNVFNSGTDPIIEITATPGTAGSESFTGIGQVLTAGTTSYFFILADVACMPVGNTISVAAITTTNLIFSSGTKSGTAYAGANQTITEGPPNDIASLTTSLCENTGTTLTWTNPTCYTEVLIFAKNGAFSALNPSGNGSTYSANSAFGSGTPFDGGFCVYKGSLATANITALTMGSTYNFKVYTRNGSFWSAAVEVSCTPLLGYCAAASLDNLNEYIEEVDISTIFNGSIVNNTSQPSSHALYSNFTSIIATVERSETFPVIIYNGDYFSEDFVYIWIDFNQDGDFVDAGEQVFSSTTVGASAPYYANITIPAGANMGNTRMRIRLYDSSLGPNATPCGDSDYGEVEDYTLNIINACVPTHSLTSFAPTSGPIGTYVTINGTGFTALSDVYFNGIQATSVEFVSSTKIIAIMPNGATTGKIKITEGSCYVQSTANFTLIEESGSCLTSTNPSYTDLFISEVYDSDAGNVAYVELYNPTNLPIDLGALSYSIRIDNRNSGDAGVSIDRTIPLTGVIPANSVFLVNLGTSGNTCVKTWGFTSGGPGFNEYDYVFLYKGGTEVDQYNSPNNTGFTAIRTTTAIAPNTTYSAGDWTLVNIEDCSNLGVGPVSTFANPTTTITNLAGCSLNMTVVVGEGDPTPTGDVTYKWFYNDGVSATWTQVTGVLPAGYTITGNATNNLLITQGTNSITDLNDYQFYCEVTEAATCKNVTNASQFTSSEKPIYRSIAGSNGNWTVVSNWEMSNSVAGPWLAACNYPKSLNSSQAIIQIGTNIVLDIDNDIDLLTVDGTLEVSPNSQLSVYDSVAGADLIINGTFYYRANAANSLILDPTATWIFNPMANFIKTNTADILPFRDKYQGGMSTIPSSGQFVYRYNGDGNPYSGAVDFFYPDLYIENTANAGNFAFNSSLMAFNGSAGFCTVKGSMYVGITGTGSVSMYNNNINSNPMLIIGNLEIQNGSTLSTDLCGTCGAASATIDNGTGFELQGNLTVDGSLQVLNGTTERVFRFTGSNLQEVTGMGTITFHKVTINKSTLHVNLNRNLQARNELKMMQGHIYTNSHTMELGVSTAQLGILTYTSGYVVGIMKRWFLNTNSNDITGLYPMGWDEGGLKNRFASVYFTTAPSAGGHLTVEFIPISMGIAGLTIPAANTGGFGFDVIMTEDQGYWKIDNEATKLVDGTYTIACTGEGFTTITDLTKLTLLKRVGGTDWFCPGTHVASSGTIAVPTCTRTGVSNWSNFGFSSALGNILPIELISFDSECGADKFTFSWVSASERDNDFYTIEKSDLNSFFSEIARIDGAGNSSQTTNYDFSISNAENGYFRLSQTDFNGKKTILETIYVNCISNSSIVFPNPSTGLFTIQMSNIEEVMVYNQLGQEVKKVKQSSQLDLTELSNGIYNLRIFNGFDSKFVKIEIVK